MGTEETQPRDAGPAPSAPGIGPLINISHTQEMVPPQGGQQSSTEGDVNAAAESPQQTLFIPSQEEGSTTQAENDTPDFVAGPARVDLMTR